MLTSLLSGVYSTLMSGRLAGNVLFRTQGFAPAIGTRQAAERLCRHREEGIVELPGHGVRRDFCLASYEQFSYSVPCDTSMMINSSSYFMHPGTSKNLSAAAGILSVLFRARQGDDGVWKAEAFLKPLACVPAGDLESAAIGVSDLLSTRPSAYFLIKDTCLPAFVWSSAPDDTLYSIGLSGRSIIGDFLSKHNIPVAGTKIRPLK